MPLGFQGVRSKFMLANTGLTNVNIMEGFKKQNLATVQVLNQRLWGEGGLRRKADIVVTGEVGVGGI